MDREIKEVFQQFEAAGEYTGSTPIDSGHINATYLISTDLGASYVLQKINHAVFKRPADVVSNKITVSKHLQRKLDENPGSAITKRVLNFCRSREGDYLYQDAGGNYWNLMDFIENSRVYLKTPDRGIALEAGRAFGSFLALTEDLDPAAIKETLPRFHSMSLRFEQFDEAVAKAPDDRLQRAQQIIECANRLRPEMHVLEASVAEGRIPLRVTHNDTKISNALFSEDGIALCVIDLDTVMRGVVHYDFGDAVRTICSSADEDEPDESKIDFSLEYFEAFVRGFIGDSGINLNEAEIEGLPISAKAMTFIVGLRFLTDYLNNDIYFDTRYDDHNLVRARSQFRRVELIEENLDAMKEIVGRVVSEKERGMGSRV